MWKLCPNSLRFRVSHCVMQEKAVCQPCRVGLQTYLKLTDLFCWSDQNPFSLPLFHWATKKLKDFWWILTDIISGYNWFYTIIVIHEKYSMKVNNLFNSFIISSKVPDLEEARVLLNLIPDRIGHGTCIHPENGGAEDLVNIVEKHSIPIGELEIHSIKEYLTIRLRARVVYEQIVNKVQPSCLLLVENEGEYR